VLLDIRQKLGLALMFITHNIAVVEYLCDRVVVLAGGEIVESGATRSVIGAPQHAYTQKLIEAVPRL
jgi:ABC-type glutathione transport system ATPase component